MNQDLETSPKSLPLIPILLGILGLTTVIFAGLFLFFYSQAQTANSTLFQAKKEASAVARSDQKKVDAAAQELSLESPFRSYQAPDEFGSFNIKFPKSWSARLAESAAGQVQVNLSVNPDFIRYKDEITQPVALRVRLIKQNSNAFIGDFDDAIKAGTLKKSSIVVSGQNGIALTGHFTDSTQNQSSFVRLVAIAVRDKVLVFTCENGLYTTQFDSTISQSKIVP
jgi:hypothetical protein